MKIYGVQDLQRGKILWVESHGKAFKTLRLFPAQILFADHEHILLYHLEDGTLHTFDADRYNQDLCWRCWDEKPDADTRCEALWDENITYTQQHFICA